METSSNKSVVDCTTFSLRHLCLNHQKSGCRWGAKKKPGWSAAKKKPSCYKVGQHKKNPSIYDQWVELEEGQQQLTRQNLESRLKAVKQQQRQRRLRKNKEAVVKATAVLPKKKRTSIESMPGKVFFAKPAAAAKIKQKQGSSDNFIKTIENIQKAQKQREENETRRQKNEKDRQTEMEKIREFFKKENDKRIHRQKKSTYCRTCGPEDCPGYVKGPNGASSGCVICGHSPYQHGGVRISSSSSTSPRSSSSPQRTTSPKKSPQRTKSPKKKLKDLGPTLAKVKKERQYLRKRKHNPTPLRPLAGYGKKRPPRFSPRKSPHRVLPEKVQWSNPQQRWRVQKSELDFPHRALSQGT